MTQSDSEVHSLRPVTVGAVNWRSVLDFTQLFRGFRLAINPGKIGLALLAILLIYSSLRLFGLASAPQVYKAEIEAFEREKPETFRRMRVDRMSAVKPGLQQAFMFA